MLILRIVLLRSSSSTNDGSISKARHLACSCLLRLLSLLYCSISCTSQPFAATEVAAESSVNPSPITQARLLILRIVLLRSSSSTNDGSISKARHLACSCLLRLLSLLYCSISCTSQPFAATEVAAESSVNPSPITQARLLILRIVLLRSSSSTNDGSISKARHLACSCLLRLLSLLYCSISCTSQPFAATEVAAESSVNPSPITQARLLILRIVLLRSSSSTNDGSISKARHLACSCLLRLLSLLYCSISCTSQPFAATEVAAESSVNPSPITQARLPIFDILKSIRLQHSLQPPSSQMNTILYCTDRHT